MRNYLFLFIAFLLFTFGKDRLCAQTVPVYHNPVLWADVPDPDVIRVGDTFYLIKRLSDLPAGTASFEDDAAAYTAAALAEQQQKEWDAVQADWLSEARNAAVFHEENYAGVGVQ